ncbi:hypothetical protein [Actinokineospora globicatena]|uniref:MYXO-CTERM domain-containing protein n=1 Tax=Actinokineospora globicatena TaxID=103729 RepID=A0A9W6QNA5_9PSEU|nr:hypothetical protein [Actinokineospora globicatena]GLW91765.1 hypothetical protein Aglo03_25810 [Actinokineospora globicatena]
MTITPRTAVAIAGLLLAAAALMLMGAELQATGTTSTISCGSAFSPKVNELEHNQHVNDLSLTLLGIQPDSNSMAGVSACRDKIDDRRLLGWIMFGIGALALGGALFVRRAQQPAQSSPLNDAS